jgi:hypothetical protein
MKARRSFIYLLSKAMADHKSPAQLINELVGKEIAAVV